jgi:hypothetical protein
MTDFYEGQPNVKPRWAPRVPMDRIRRLYESVARGLVDDDLLGDVGFRIYLRCKSILVVRDIYERRCLACPACGQTICLGPASQVLEGGTQRLRCESCQWEMPWRDYWLTFRHQELGPGGATDIFEEYVGSWEAARTEREKVLAIDRVIHQWHWATKVERPSFGLGRPTAVNLIEGNRRDVIAFLDRLSYGECSPDEIVAQREAWQAGWQEVKERQAQWRAKRDAKGSSK